MSFDFARVKTYIEEQALAGLRATAEYALGRAQHHAPVRAIFERTRRGEPEVPRSWVTMRSRQRYKAFLRSKERRVGVPDIEGANAPRPPSKLAYSPNEMTAQNPTGGYLVGGGPTQYEALQHEAKLQTSTTPYRGERKGRRGAFGGQANTLIPVFRSGGFRLTGDFRRFDPSSRTLTKVPGFTEQTGPGGTTRAVERGVASRARDRMISTRGRYEIKHARSRGLFEGRVGGRLRGELRIRGPEKHSGSWWMYVESPTPYAPYQEFGTRRHRAAPFLRPALYESRNVLRFEVSKAVDKRFNALPAGTAEGD